MLVECLGYVMDMTLEWQWTSMTSEWIQQDCQSISSNWFFNVCAHNGKLLAHATWSWANKNDMFGNVDGPTAFKIVQTLGKNCPSLLVDLVGAWKSPDCLVATLGHSGESLIQSSVNYALDMFNAFTVMFHSKWTTYNPFFPTVHTSWVLNYQFQ